MYSGLRVYLLLGNLHSVTENRPEHSGAARWGGQGPLVAVVLSRLLRKQLLNVEAWDAYLLTWGDIEGGAGHPHSLWQPHV